MNFLNLTKNSVTFIVATILFLGKIEASSWECEQLRERENEFLDVRKQVVNKLIDHCDNKFNSEICRNLAYVLLNSQQQEAHWFDASSSLNMSINKNSIADNEKLLIESRDKFISSFKDESKYEDYNTNYIMPIFFKYACLYKFLNSGQSTWNASFFEECLTEKQKNWNEVVAKR